MLCFTAQRMPRQKRRGSICLLATTTAAMIEGIQFKVSRVCPEYRNKVDRQVRDVGSVGDDPRGGDSPFATKNAS